tara:strand:+ start:2022 stop:2219 length:198 start_codon:yes stop_codon:yes gene_type:complete
MARLSYKGWYISCRPLRDSKKDWILEIEKGNVVHSHIMASTMTVGRIENFAYDKIDYYVKEEAKK